MKRSRLAVISDLDPNSHPGANLIAFEYAKAAAQEFNTEFWTSRVKELHKTPVDSDSLSMHYIDLSQKFFNFPKRGLKHKTFREIISIPPLVWILLKAIKFRPDLVWVHQIGNVFPYSIFSLFRLMRIPAIFTSHDFGTLVPRKLYPGDLNLGPKDLSVLFDSYQTVGHANRTLCLNLSTAYFIRLKFLKFFLKGVNIVGISQMQTDILKSNGIRVVDTISNGVSACKCEFWNSRRLEAILFAGRPNGKGLSHVLTTVKNHPTIMLHLAGSEELLNQAKSVLSNNRIVFHGQLNTEELFRVMHEVRFLAALSECFDVYPSVVLEALVHGCAPFCYPSVGNANLACKVHESLIIDYGSSIESDVIDAFLIDDHYSQKLSSVGRELPSFLDVYADYRDLFHRVIAG